MSEQNIPIENFDTSPIASVNEIPLDPSAALLWLSAIIESADDAIVSKTLDGVITSWNKGAENIFGYAAAEMIGEPIAKLFPPERLDEETRIIEKIKSGDKIKHFETVRLRKDGSPVEISLTVSPIKAVDGTIIGVSKIAREITDRKRIEKALGESEELYRIVAETASDAIISINERSEILFINRAATRIFGYEVGQMIGQSLTMLMPEYLREIHKAGFKRYLTTGKRHLSWEHIELPGLHLDGREIPLELSFGEFASDDNHIFIGIARDISERKKSEAQLRDSENQFSTLADSVPQLVWMAEPDGFIFWYNQNWYEYTGTTPDEMKGWGWQTVHDPQTLPQVVEKWQKSIANSEAFEMEFPLRSKTGEFRWFLTRVNPLRDESGEIIRWFGTNTDIEELRQTRLQAEQANRLKDEFLATLSHELRTPLNAILGWSQILRSGNPGKEQIEKALSTIERSARVQSQLIDDILDVSRIITGKLRLDVRSVDLANVIEAAIETVRPAAEAKNIRLQSLLDSQVEPISGDSDRLQQVIWNLLSNAVKFTPKGGRVQIRLERINSRLEVTVSDTGKGIEPDFLPFVFDRFRQSDGTTTRRHGGLGLGLAIVRQIVELHGGTVTVTSEGENRGSTFVVCLPLLPIRNEITTDASKKAAVGRPHQKSLSIDCPPELTGLRVLLVDDEADSRELLKIILEKCEADITTASSAAEAFELFQNAQFDIIISDIGMPDEDGFSLIRKIRKLSAERRGKIPAIALTAYARAEDRQQALRAGFQMHVAKPVEPEELLTVMANLAGRFSP